MGASYTWVRISVFFVRPWFQKKGQKLRCVLYTRQHGTRNFSTRKILQTKQRELPTKRRREEHKRVVRHSWIYFLRRFEMAGLNSMRFQQGCGTHDFHEKSGKWKDWDRFLAADFNERQASFLCPPAPIFCTISSEYKGILKRQQPDVVRPLQKIGTRMPGVWFRE